MTTDAELEVWRQVWCDQTAPLPELKKKIRRQNLRTVAGIIAIVLCIAISTYEAWLHRSVFMAGMATGASFASLAVGAYAWSVRRSAWKPSAQTTLAYAELAWNRAVAKARLLRFSFYFLLAASFLLAAMLAWHRSTSPFRDWGIVVALAGESLYMRYMGQRKLREVAETKKLVDDLTN
jgi:hypothetical protein